MIGPVGMVATAGVVALVAVLGAGVCAAVGLLAGLRLRGWIDRHKTKRARTGRRILVPFTGQALSRRAFDAAISLARAQDATIVPAFLARVPRHLPLQAALPAQADGAMALAETLEQRATRSGVPVDARVGRGRTYRDALRRLLDEERFDQIVMCAPDAPRHGLTHDDLRWLLTRVPAEVLILKPAPDDRHALRAPAAVLAAEIGSRRTRPLPPSRTAIAPNSRRRHSSSQQARVPDRHE